MNTFKPMKSRLRATFAAGGVNEPRLGEIDREHEVLHGVQITLEGEALGHGIWLDRAFCEAVAEAGNAMGDAGVKVRFGHPAMCSDALGTYLGRAKNFTVVDLTRKDGVAAAGVLADIEIAPEAHHAPSGDLAAWVLETAANSPDTFGQSIVFTYADFKVKDGEGGEYLRSAYEDEAEWKSKSHDGRCYAVMGKLLGTDFTDTPAATDGVFSAGDLAAEAEAMLEEHPQILGVLESNPDAVCQFLTRVGILDKVESKRVSNLQAEKDREIAALKKIVAERDELCTTTVSNSEAEIVSLKAQNGELCEMLAKVRDEFESQLMVKEEKLTAALAQVEQLTRDLDTTKADLAARGEQLTKVQSTLSMLGHNVNSVPETECFNYVGELSKARTAEEKIEVARRQIRKNKKGS